jgi:hypothetical protein
MASTLFSKLRRIASISFYQIPKHDYYTYPGLLVLPVFHFGYVQTTKQTSSIVVASKYLYTYGGYTRFMLVDSTGKHYTLENSIWFWRWNSIEDWDSIPTEKPINVQYYGWRIAPLGIFPNIVASDKPVESDEPNRGAVSGVDYPQLLTF